VQLAPRPIVDAIVRQIIPDADHRWRAAGVDEFLRAYLTAAGRAAFYAAARHIYLDEPHGNDGFWTRLASLQALRPRDPASTSSNGVLGDVAPTVLKLLGIEQPTAMTGRSLIEAAAAPTVASSHGGGA
jgi:hypothetical protein